MRKSKNRYLYNTFVSPGDAPWEITLNVVWMEREFDAYKLSRWMCPSDCKRFWDRAIYLSKIVIFHTPLHLTPPLGGFPSEHRHPVCMKKLEWCGYQMVKKFRRYLYSFWRNSRTWQTDGRTDGHRVTATAALCIASHGKNESSMFYIGPRCIVDGTLWMLSLAAMLVNRRTLLCYARLMAWSACPSVCCLYRCCVLLKWLNFSAIFLDILTALGLGQFVLKYWKKIPRGSKWSFKLNERGVWKPISRFIVGCHYAIFMWKFLLACAHIFTQLILGIYQDWSA